MVNEVQLPNTSAAASGTKKSSTLKNICQRLSKLYITRTPSISRGKPGYVSRKYSKRKNKMRINMRLRMKRSLNLVKQKKLSVKPVEINTVTVEDPYQINPQKQFFLKNFLQLLHDQWREVQNIKHAYGMDPVTLLPFKLPEQEFNYPSNVKSRPINPTITISDVYFARWRYDEKCKRFWDNMFLDFQNYKSAYFAQYQTAKLSSNAKLIARTKSKNVRVHFYRKILSDNKQSTYDVRLSLFLCHLLTNVRLISEFRVLREKTNINQHLMYLSFFQKPIAETLNLPSEHLPKRPSYPKSVAERWKEKRRTLIEDLQWLRHERERMVFRIHQRKHRWGIILEDVEETEEDRQAAIEIENEFEKLNALITERLEQLREEDNLAMKNDEEAQPLSDCDTLLQRILAHENSMQQLLNFLEDLINELEYKIKIQMEKRAIDETRELTQQLKQLKTYQYYLLDQYNYGQQLIPKSCVIDLLEHKMDAITKENQAKYMWHLFDVYKLANKIYDVYIEHKNLNL